MKRNLYLPVPAVIEEIIDETPTIKTFVFRPEEPVPFAAGQFVELTVPGLGEAPFTPSSSPFEDERIAITIMRVGRVTDALHGMALGAKVGLRGPMGEAYPLDRFRGREVLVVGGGCGGGPLRALLYAMLGELDSFPRIRIRYGARSPDEIVYRKDLSSGWGQGDRLDVKVTVDNAGAGWDGHVGVVTTILEEEHLDCDPAHSVVATCGPPVMMRFTVKKLLERGFAPKDVYLSMEMNMSCGVGKCGHCRMGPYYVCKQGPVFTYDQLEGIAGIWEHAA